MAIPKRAADNIDTALERESNFDLQNNGLSLWTDSTVDWAASYQNTKTGSTWNDDKQNSFLRSPGMWEYTTGDKPTRIWIDRHEQPRLEESPTSDLNRVVFDAEQGDREISRAYHDLCTSGRLKAFIHTIHDQFNEDSLHPLPMAGFIKVWRCLVGELVPKDKQWPGIPDHILANPDNIWRVANNVFQLVTGGRYCDTQETFAPGTANGKSFNEFRAEILEKKCRYRKESLNLLLSSLRHDPLRRPTRPEILDHCSFVLGASEGGKLLKDLRIPTGLRLEEEAVYEHLLEVAKERKLKSQPPPRIVVITDINKDVDDLVAMVLLKELNRLGLVELKGFVANLKPARKRTLAGRGALDALGLPSIPIAIGTDAEIIKEGEKPREIHPYEFDECPFMASEDTNLEDGATLLTSLCAEAWTKREKLTFLLISGLRDINDFTKTNADLLRATTERIVLQGGYRVEEEDGTERLIVDEKAANNSFDLPAAEQFHQYMATQKIPSTSYTKTAAFATDIPEQLLIDLEDTGHPIGAYLHKSQVEMDVAFYEQSCSPVETERFKPFMNQEWYLRNKSSYYQTPHPEGASLPVGEEVVQYFDKLVAYDALAALAAGGDDILDRLKISRYAEGPKSLHRVVGVDEQKEVQADPAKGIKAQPYRPKDPGINGHAMAQAIRALVRGSLLACRQGFPSFP